MSKGQLLAAGILAFLAVYYAVLAATTKDEQVLLRWVALLFGAVTAGLAAMLLAQK